MKQTTKRLVSITFALALVIAAGAIFIYLIQPAYAELQQVRSEEISRRQFVDSQQEAIGEVRNLIASYEEAGTLQTSVSSALPLTPDFSDVLAQIDGLAAANGLALQSLAVTTPSAQSNRFADRTARATVESSLVRPVGLITFQVRFTSTYAGAKTFLQNLETNLRIFDVQSMGIAPAGKPTQDLYTIDLTVVTYYQQP